MAQFVTGFAVLDLETTGFRNSDRIVEIGIVQLDGNLQFESEWCTLVNPHRDVSAGAIHGITASDVASAPSFAVVAKHLAALMEGRVLIAHNAAFDLRMLAHAFESTPVGAPTELVVIDTLRLSRDVLGGPASLALVCEYLSITHSKEHSALDDARATAEVFVRLMEQSDGVVATGASLRHFSAESVASNEFFEEVLTDVMLEYATYNTWAGADMLADAPVHTRELAFVARADHDSYLARLLSDLPATSGLAGADLDPYLLRLEEALLDRYVSEDEAESLVALARELKLSTARVREANLSFLAALARVAMADAVVTQAERADLDLVSRLLGLAVEDVDAALAEASIGGFMQQPALSTLTLSPGDRVVFTGEASVPRSVLATRAALVGLVETSSVSKKTRVVVMADPLSESTKARRARELSIPILAEAVFIQLCDDVASGARGQYK